MAKTYLQTDIQNVSSQNDFAYYGTIEDENIGYLSIRKFRNDESGWEEEIDRAIEALEDTDAMIIDVRNNPGGADKISSRLAGAFTKSVELAYTKKTKNSPGRNDFDEPVEFYTQAEGAAQYTKSVVVLINSFSTSAAEVFGLFLHTQEHVTFVGIPTSTAFSDVSFIRYLPNGWFYTLSHQLYSYPDGTPAEGLGIVPDIEIRNSPEDVANGIDRVLERGVDLLR